MGRIRITIERARFDLSGRALRRARRLYARIIRRRVLRGRFIQWRILNDCAERARNRGLYADTVTQWEAIFSLMRYIWRIQQSGPHPVDWHKWCELHNFGRSRVAVYARKVRPRRALVL